MKAKRNLIRIWLLCGMVLTAIAAKAQPVITQQPTNQLVSLGSNAVFTVAASGTAPIRYQWHFTNSTYFPAGAYAQTLSGFVYGVVVTNGGQGYTLAPQVQFVGGGGSGAVAYASVSNGIVSSINVSNAGSGYTSVPTVQIASPNGLMPGQTNATLNLSGVTNNNIGNYFCVITNGSGSVTSSVVWLKLAATIITPPTNQIVWAGQPASFGVIADAAGSYTYQWLFNGTNISGATSSGLNIPSVSISNAGNYTVLVSNQNSSVLSAPAILSVDWISQQPRDQLATNGGNATISVAANGTGNFSYQWLFNGISISTNLTLIITVAGNGSAAYSGDGGAATSASLHYPFGVTVDKWGNLYIADYWNNRIRKVDTNGIITTVVGNGTSSYSGDGGAATNASLNTPHGVTVDSAGNLYIADQGNNRIRKVGTNGIITTVAGNGISGYSTGGSIATNAMLNNPSGMAVDSAGNLYIADGGNNCIRRVNTDGISIVTMAGNTTNGYLGDGGVSTIAELSYPSGVTVDSAVNLYIADQDNNRVRKVDTNDIITTLAGNGTNSYSGDGGAATNAGLSNPSGITVDSANNIYIAENKRIRKVGTNGIITTVAGNGINNYSGDGGVATNASLNDPSGITMDSAGNLYIADTVNNRIRKVFFGGAVGFYPVSTNNIGSYQVVITDVITGNSITSSVASLFMAPFVTTQPQSQNVWTGATTTFTNTTGGSPPFSYQWQFNGIDIAGATNATYALNNISTNSAGNYSIVVSSLYGTNSSSAAALTINFISQPPTNQFMTNGGVANFNVGVTGPGPFNYQWLFNGTNLSGKTQSSLAVSNITMASVGNYSAIVSLTNNSSITSSVAALNLAYPPSISQQPQTLNVAQGNNAVFSVSASGTPEPNYQWWMVSGTKTNATAVSVVINGFVLGANITRGGAGYLSIPAVQFVGGGGSGASGTAVVSNRMVTAINIGNAGSGYTTPPGIQIGAPTAISITGQNNSILNLLALTNGNAGNYYVVVTNNYGSVTSSIASLIVGPVGYNQISSPVLSNGKMNLSFVGLQGSNYALDRSFSLSPANWIPQVTNPADANGNIIFTNTPNAATNNFWRIRSVP